MSIRVTDTTLDLTHQTLKLSGTNPEYITATNFHTDVTFTKSNNNIRITKEIQNDDQIAFLVTPIQSGTTTFTFTDSEGNRKEVVVTIGGNSQDTDTSENSENTSDTSESISDTELDTLLEDIFRELGVQSSEEIQINSYSVSDNAKEKLDRAIKNIISQKGESYVIQFLEYLHQNKTHIAEKYQQKYTKYSLENIIYTFDIISQYFEKNLEFQIIHSVQDISNGVIGGLEFQVGQNLQGKISEIGVQYINANGVKQKQVLTNQSDGKYIVAFSQDSCNGCTDLKPYYLLSGRTDIIIASVDGEQVTISSSSYDIFKNVLISIWFWKGYDKEYNRGKKKVLDIKEDIRGNSINIILQSIATTAGLKIDTKYININTLPVAGYMLDKFLNGPVYSGEKTEKGLNEEGQEVTYILYDDNHWIANKFKNSVDYKNVIKIALNNRCNNSNFINLENLNEGEKTFCVIKDSDSFNFGQELDLFMAVHSYKFSISFTKVNNEIYSEVTFWDEYDFEPNDYGFSTTGGKNFRDVLKNNLANNLNYLGNYYEKELNGNTYYWKVNIKNKVQ